MGTVSLSHIGGSRRAVWAWTLGLVLPLTGWSVGCDARAERLPPGVDHPLANRLASAPLQGTSRLFTTDPQPGDADGRGAAGPSILDRIPEDPEELDWIGALDRPSGQGGDVFGAVTDARALGRDILVLDRRMGRLSRYSQAGDLLEILARPGRGPGELLDPRAMAVQGEELAIVDASLHVHFFGIAGPGYRRSVGIGSEATDLCAVGGDLLLLGFSPADPGVVHRLQGDSVVRRFGILYESEDEVLRQLLSQGQIACDRERRRVYLA